MFKSVILVFPVSKFLTLNIVALIVTPITLVLLALCEYFLARSRENEHPSETSEPRESSLPRRYFQRLSLRGGASVPQESSQSFGASRWFEAIWRHMKFWVALGIAITLQLLLMWGYVLFNPFVRFIHVFYPHLFNSKYRLSILCLTLCY